MHQKKKLFTHFYYNKNKLLTSKNKYYIVI